MDERLLAERLITYDTASKDGLRAAAGFVKGWLEARDIRVVDGVHQGLPVIMAEVGPTGPGVPRVIFHGHVDVVPAHPGQFEPRVEGDRLYGRGAYDMKGALATMMLALRDVGGQGAVNVRFVCVPDEESDDVDSRSIDALVAGPLGDADFAVTGEPTDLHIGVQAKGVLAVRVEVHGRAAHGSTPWLGDNAILKAHDVFRRIETLPFSRMSSDLFDRPSINLSRIAGGDAFNKVPDSCWVDVDIRYLPNQDPGEILAQIRSIADLEIVRCFNRVPAIVSRSNPYVLALRAAVGRAVEGDALSVGRDGASDAVSFLEHGIPAVEFGPVGGGHHGPEEWVSLSSLQRYRAALGTLVDELPAALREAAQPQPLRVVSYDGGRVAR
ncbi:M20 family metallopeptidase [Capillimicrobium parvum]|nr:M20/M25/M40 family metallo-hydrolase [Capillimicrobium parvum]